MGGCLGTFRGWALSAVLVSQAVLAGCGDDAPVTGGTIQHWDGSRWSLSTWTGGANSRYLSGVWGSGPNDVWAVGLGVVLHGDGATWTPAIQDNDERAFLSVWGSGPDDVWVGGAGVRHWNGAAWSIAGLPEGVGEIVEGWSRRPDDAWAVAGVRILVGDPAVSVVAPAVLHWDGTAWTIVWRSPELQRDYLSSIWGSATGEVWAAGNRGDNDDALVVHWNGSTWTEKDLPMDGSSDVWASGPTDLWVTTYDGVPMHWDGVDWARVSRGPGEISAMWGSAPDDVWFFGDFPGGTHWNGAQWSRRAAPEAHGIGAAAWGSGPNDVWVVGGVAQ